MMSAGSISQDIDYDRQIQEALDELQQMQETPQLVSSPEEFEALERAIRQRTDRLGSLLVGHHLQQSLDSDTLQAEQALLVRHWPKPLRGYPETLSLHRHKLMQHPCGNETQDDRKERVGSA